MIPAGLASSNKINTKRLAAKQRKGGEKENCSQDKYDATNNPGVTGIAVAGAAGKFGVGKGAYSGTKKERI